MRSFVLLPCMKRYCAFSISSWLGQSLLQAEKRKKENRNRSKEVLLILIRILKCEGKSLRENDLALEENKLELRLKNTFPQIL